MAVLVVGSIALDTLTTPSGKAEETLGGSAVYFSLGARPFDSVRVVGVVGPDFPVLEKRFLEEKGIDLGGLQTGQGPTKPREYRPPLPAASRQGLQPDLDGPGPGYPAKAGTRDRGLGSC